MILANRVQFRTLKQMSCCVASLQPNRVRRRIERAETSQQRGLAPVWQDQAAGRQAGQRPILLAAAHGAQPITSSPPAAQQQQLPSSTSVPPDATSTGSGLRANEFFRRGEEGAARQALFDSIAPVYDELNDSLSLGLHRIWKRMTVQWSGAAAGQAVLDVCCGSGDLALLLAEAVGPSGSVVGLDFAPAMLADARQRAAAVGPGTQRRRAPLRWVQGDALALPFEPASFDAVTMGYGLRNVADIPRALGVSGAAACSVHFDWPGRMGGSGPAVQLQLPTSLLSPDDDHHAPLATIISRNYTACSALVAVSQSWISTTPGTTSWLMRCRFANMMQQ